LVFKIEDSKVKHAKSSVVTKMIKWSKKTCKQVSKKMDQARWVLPWFDFATWEK